MERRRPLEVAPLHPLALGYWPCWAHQRIRRQATAHVSNGRKAAGRTASGQVRLRDRCRFGSRVAVTRSLPPPRWLWVPEVFHAPGTRLRCVVRWSRAIGRIAANHVLKRCTMCFHIRSSGQGKGSAVGFSFEVLRYGSLTRSFFRDQQLEQ